jgi:WD40 repeat protein
MILINDELLVGQSDGGIHVIDAVNRVEKRLLKYHDSGVFGLFHEPVHGMVFSLSGDGVLAVLDASDLSMQKKLSLGTGKLRSVAVDPGAGLLAVGAGDGSVYVFTLPDLKPVKHWQAHQEGFSVNAVEFSHDGSLLLTGSRDAHLKVFDVNDDFKEKQSIPAHNYAIYSIEFNPDGNLFATASRDKTIKIWDSKTMNVLQRLDREKHSGHVNSVNKIIWHPGGTLISASDDRSVISWRMMNDEL